MDIAVRTGGRPAGATRRSGESRTVADMPWVSDCASRSAVAQSNPRTSVSHRSTMRWRRTIVAAAAAPPSVSSTDRSPAIRISPSRARRWSETVTVGALTPSHSARPTGDAVPRPRARCSRSPRDSARWFPSACRIGSPPALMRMESTRTPPATDPRRTPERRVRGAGAGASRLPRSSRRCRCRGRRAAPRRATH